MRRGRFTIAFNGEIFNHLELRAELEAEGHSFVTQSDTEVLLAAFEHWGTEALPRLNGQFAFVLWDREIRECTVARDRYGIRPLYVLEFGNAIYFASEMKAFDSIPGFSRSFDVPCLFEHGLFWNTLSDRTVYQGIRSVEAGTYERFDAGGRRVVGRYHQIGEQHMECPRTFEGAIEMLRDKLTRATALRLRSDVPVGNYLSGGIDSSVITLLTDRLRTDTFRTFSIAFEDASFDESTYQREMTDLLDSNPHTREISYEDIDKNFERAVWHGERPLFRTAPVPLYLLAKDVRAGDIRVVLTGEGADEILWGYDSYKELKLLQFWARQPESSWRPLLIRTLYPHLAHFKDSKQFGLMRMFYEGFLGSYDNALAGLNIRVHNNRILTKYFRPEHCEGLDGEWLRSRVEPQIPASSESWSLLQRNQFLEMRTLLPGYLLSSQGDRMSLAHGIEGRYPFLDHEVVEWAFHLPDDYKMKLLSQKHLLRESFRRELPASIVDRPKQPYQAPDLLSFFREGKLSRTAAKWLTARSLEDVGIFDPKMVARLLAKFGRGVPERIGYRDNMVICFLLSTQMAAHHASHPQAASPLDPDLRTVDIRD